jgi:CheY-like chemotaxis protein
MIQSESGSVVIMARHVRLCTMPNGPEMTVALLLEDEPLIALHVEQVLADAGFYVNTVSTCADALEWLKSEDLTSLSSTLSCAMDPAIQPVLLRTTYPLPCTPATTRGARRHPICRRHLDRQTGRRRRNSSRCLQADRSLRTRR